MKGLIFIHRLYKQCEKYVEKKSFKPRLHYKLVDKLLNYS